MSSKGSTFDMVSAVFSAMSILHSPTLSHLNVGNSDWWCSDICQLEAKHTDTILTWFGKLPTSTGEAIALYRESTRFTTIEKEESSPLWQLSTSLYFSLLSVAMAATASCLGSPLSPTFLTSLALLSLSHFLILLSTVCLYL
jgi:hypothetical protein